MIPLPENPEPGRTAAAPPSIVLSIFVVASAAVVALGLVGFFATVLCAAPLTDRAANTCAEQGEESGGAWRWLPPAWMCTRTFGDGRTVTGRIRLQSPDTFSP